jgi:hypothetical protein
MLDLQRLPDWRVRLDDMINDVRRKPYAIGTFDCGPSFTGRAVEAVTGVNVLAPYAGRYSTEDEALALIFDEGPELPDIVASMLPEYAHASEAKVGDLAAIPISGPFGWALGVVNGERIFVLRGDGLGTIGLLAAKRAFRVGR